MHARGGLPLRQHLAVPGCPGAVGWVAATLAAASTAAPGSALAAAAAKARRALQPEPCLAGAGGGPSVREGSGPAHARGRSKGGQTREPESPCLQTPASPLDARGALARVGKADRVSRKYQMYQSRRWGGTPARVERGETSEEVRTSGVCVRAWPVLPFRAARSGTIPMCACSNRRVARSDYLFFARRGSKIHPFKHVCISNRVSTLTDSDIHPLLDGTERLTIESNGRCCVEKKRGRVGV